MTDQNTLAEKVQKIAAEMRDAMRREDDGYPYAEFLSDMGDYIKDLEALLPAPPRPTLADMTAEERTATIGMWATIDPGDGSDTRRGIITRANRRLALVAHPADLRVELKPTVTPADTVTPDPSVPRAWNANGTPAHPEPAPALPDGWRLADHPQRGRVIVTNTEPDVHGDVWFVRRDPYGGAKGYDVGCCKPDVLTYIDQEADQ